METLYKNKLLADFAVVELLDLGIGVLENLYLNNGGQWQPDKDLNQLMLVVDKIKESVREIRTTITNGNASVYFINSLDVIMIKRHSNTLHQALYDACVEYINVKNK